MKDQIVENNWVCNTPSEFRSKLGNVFNLGPLKSRIVSLLNRKKSFLGKISISQNPATSTTGMAPIRESVEYYLDTSTLDLVEARSHIEKNRGDYPWVEEETLKLLSDPESLDDSIVEEIGIELAQREIGKLNSKLPAIPVNLVLTH